jgi:hypothetical protein
MWILKGVFLGAWLFEFGTIAFLYLSVYRNLSPKTAAVGVTVLTGFTLQNPLWWAALAACVVLGCALVGSWPVGPGKSSLALWIVLGVTFLIPLGLIGLFMAMVAKLKEAAHPH